MHKAKILNVLGDEKVRLDDPLKNHTSFKTGGPADVLVNVANADELIKTIEYAKEENVKFYTQKCLFSIDAVEMDGNVELAQLVLER